MSKKYFHLCKRCGYIVGMAKVGQGIADFVCTVQKQCDNYCSFCGKEVNVEEFNSKVKELENKFHEQRKEMNELQDWCKETLNKKKVGK